MSVCGPLVATADIAGAVNDVRLHGCHGNSGTRSLLHENPRLDEAARGLARGYSLEDAAARAGYRALSSTTVRITNVPSDRDIERMVEGRFCQQALDREMRELGAYRRGPDVWLVLAVPFSPPRPSEQAEIGRRVLELTNRARSRTERCGNTVFPAAKPLVVSPVLNVAALAHSQDMAAHGYLDHTGHDGSTPADRISRTGYRWLIVGENVASGVVTPEEAVAGWLASPHHCENLMSNRFSEMGIAYASNASSAGGIYWTQVFATHR